jgi:DNA polymerase I-like protein with 3'-5' exonuclease and polymerase domains
MPFDSTTSVLATPAQVRPPRIKTAIWDIETDGLLHQMTRIHCLTIRDYERNITYRFRSNGVEETIHLGIEMLLEAEWWVGHNLVAFDVPAVEMIFGALDFQGRIRDTLVLARVVFANQKDLDFRLHDKGILPGKYIGAHKLEAWGHRLGLQKGEYSTTMEEKAKELGITDKEAIHQFVWGSWNQDMDDYCALDVDVTTLLWSRIVARMPDDRAVLLEHQIHDIMAAQEREGWPFDVAKAQKLEGLLREESERLHKTATEHFGFWWAPKSKHQIMPLWDPDGGSRKRGMKAKRKQKVKAKVYMDPRPQYGEDDSRAIWGEVFVPSRTANSKNPLKASRMEGAPYCPIQRKEFNPGSRDHIIDRFTTVYDWEPVDFTETGRPSVDDTVLRGLIGRIPMAEELAELFYYMKRLGQLADGKEAWLKKVDENGFIHHYCNVGGTISGRASHVGPNLGQVPAVVKKKVKIERLPFILDWNSVKKDEFEIPMFGRPGDHGWESRELFYTLPGFINVGSDLQGIELRCLGEQLQPYDNGEYLDVILSRDIHSYNQSIAELETRAQAKTFIYALIYGGGDVKLGSIVSPLAKEEEQREIGARLRARFMNNLRGFKEVMQNVARWARKGAIPGLDGRLLPVRSEHSALNTKLQSDAALIAKKWVVDTHYALLDMGLVHGWSGDFSHLGWIHDEMQIAAKIGLENEVARVAIECAAGAGKYFGYVCPIAAEAKIGENWAVTH